jgi:hypothetical protein
MALRLENRKLETALTLLSKPMVLSSDSEDETNPGQKNDRKRKLTSPESSSTVVIALPQGEAQERIDSLLQENAKLAAEIVDLRRISGDTSCASTSTGIASIFEKNKELESQVKASRDKIAAIETNHANALRTANGKNEKELRKIRYEKKYVQYYQSVFTSLSSELEARIRELEQGLLMEKDVRDTESHSLKVEIEALTGSLELVKKEYESLARIAAKIVRNVRYQII